MTRFPWFVVNTEPMRETVVVDRLKDHGYLPYLPKTRLETGRVVPLFPRYLFVSAVERWWPIRNTVGVRAILMSGVRPAMVRHEIIAELWRRERGGIVPAPGLRRRGERITVHHGPFRDHLAIYLRSVGGDRERVLIELLGRMVLIDLPARDLR